MLSISHVLLYVFATGPKPISPRGCKWPELRGGIWCQINIINSCRVYWTAKDNTVITANLTQIFNPAHGWGQSQG